MVSIGSYIAALTDAPREERLETFLLPKPGSYASMISPMLLLPRRRDLGIGRRR